MTWTMATGFILGVGIATLIFFMGVEIGCSKALNKSERILSLMETCQIKDKEIKRLNKLVDELLNENKSFKKAIANWRAEQNENNWGY